MRVKRGEPQPGQDRESAERHAEERGRGEERASIGAAQGAGRPGCEQRDHDRHDAGGQRDRDQPCGALRGRHGERECGDQDEAGQPGRAPGRVGPPRPTRCGDRGHRVLGEEGVAGAQAPACSLCFCTVQRASCARHRCQRRFTARLDAGLRQAQRSAPGDAGPRVFEGHHGSASGPVVSG